MKNNIYPCEKCSKRYDCQMTNLLNCQKYWKWRKPEATKILIEHLNNINEQEIEQNNQVKEGNKRTIFIVKGVM